MTPRERQYEEALNRIANLEPEQATVPLDRVFALLREAIQIAKASLEQFAHASAKGDEVTTHKTAQEKQ